MKLEDFDYYLPEELIAQVPIKDRDQSRLLVLDRINKTMEDKVFKEIILKFYLQGFMVKKILVRMLSSYF